MKKLLVMLLLLAPVAASAATAVDTGPWAGNDGADMPNGLFPIGQTVVLPATGDPAKPDWAIDNLIVDALGDNWWRAYIEETCNLTIQKSTI